MNAQHSPAPWRVSRTKYTYGFAVWAVTPDSTEATRVCGVGLNDVPGQAEANARLIAAAPELLDALIDCRRALEIANAAGELAVVNAAIAKATGDA